MGDDAFCILKDKAAPVVEHLAIAKKKKKVKTEVIFGASGI